MKYPFLLLTPPLIAGILIGAHFELSFFVGMVVIAASLLIYFILTRATLDPNKALKRSVWHMMWVVILFLGLGIVVEAFSRPEEYPLDRLTAPITAEVDEITTPASGDRMVVSIGGVKALVHTDASPARKGDIIILPPKFRRITEDPNYFSKDYTDRMRRSGILYEVSVPGESVVVTGHRHTISTFSADLKEDMACFIEQTGLNPQTRNFLITLLLGSKENITPATRAVFADAGIAHILALSGMHIAIVAGLLLMFFLPLSVAGKYKWRYLLTVIVIWGYTFITGLAPSTVRASLMASFVFIGFILERRNTPLNALLAAAFCILVFQPRTVYDLGAQLSFLSVAALVMFVGPLNVIDRRRHPRLYTIISAVLTSLVASIATWPLVSYAFGRLPLLFLPVNILVLPLLPIYLAISLIYFGGWACGFDLRPLGWSLDTGYSLLLRLCEFISGGGTSVADFHVPASTVFIWCVSLVIAGVVMLMRRRRHRIWGYVTSALFALMSIAGVGIEEEDFKHGFIIQDYLRHINILSLSGAQEQRVVMQPHTISTFTHAKHTIVAVDCDVPSITEPAIHNIPQVCDYLIVAGGFKESVDKLMQSFSCDTLIIHPSVRKNREAVLIEEADRLGIPVHSLRRDGPLRYIESFSSEYETDKNNLDKSHLIKRVH